METTWNADFGSLAVDPRISIDGPARYNCCSEPTLAFPATEIDDARTVFLGPTFAIADVPLPGAAPLLGLGLAALAGAARRRARQSAIPGWWQS